MPAVTDKKTLDALGEIAKAVMGEGAIVAHASRPTNQADWDALNPNSLETDCRECDTYFTVELGENESHPEKLVCPECGSNNHGCVGSPAGAMHLALHDLAFD